MLGGGTHLGRQGQSWKEGRKVRGFVGELPIHTQGEAEVGTGAVCPGGWKLQPATNPLSPK